MTRIIKAGDIAFTELPQLLQSSSIPTEARCWLEAPDGWALDYWRGMEGTVSWNGAGRAPTEESLQDVLPRITTGRVFAPSGELKWRVMPALGDHS